MVISIPTEYTQSVFFEYAGHPEKTSNGYRASCPICREGNSWGKRKRLYYFIEDKYFYCHNCSSSWSDFMWIRELTGKTYLEIKEALLDQYDRDDLFSEKVSFDFVPDSSFIEPPLPEDSINLLDKMQLGFYRDSFFVKTAAAFLHKRGIMKSLYKPNSFYISLDDFIHKNRLIIPFYGNDNKVEFYQSRALTETQQKRAKYLSKKNSEKYVFNIHNVDYEFDYIFIMEGALDACFIKNGLAISGVYLTEYQSQLLQTHCPLMKKVWVLDNPKIDATGRERLLELAIDSNDLFFTWSDQFSKYKDLNEFCLSNNVWDIDPNEIVKRSLPGPQSIFKI